MTNPSSRDLEKEPEYTPAVRWGWIHMLATWLALCLLLVWPTWLWRAFGPPTGSDPLHWLQGGLIYYSAIFVGAACVLLRGAWRIARSGQTPYPGEWLFARRRIRRGWFAYAVAACNAFGGVWLLVAVVAFWLDIQAPALFFGIGTYVPDPPAGC